MRGSVYANASRGDDGPVALMIFFHSWIPCDEQRRVRRAKINAVLLPRDLQCLAKFGGAVGPLPGLVQPATPGHDLLTPNRFQGANQDRLRYTGWLTNGIHAIMQAIDQINICMAWLPKHRPVAVGQPGRGMTSRVIDQVSLGLHDNPATPAFGGSTHQPMT